MYAHREARLAYLAHPRTASVATGHALHHQAGFCRVGGHHEGMARGLERIGGERGVWTAVTAVRHHWDALVSWHCGGHGDPGPLTTDRLEAIVEGNGYLPDPNRLWGLHRGADRRVRYEGLTTGLNRVLVRHGLPAVELPERNVSTGRKGRAYEGFYTDASRRWVAERYSEEISDLGYEF